MKWTIEQRQAIETKDCNLLVAAGAGSGKTAVLVQRIIEKILNDKIDIDKILVVTFTKAAASEMRERIANSLYKELDTNQEIRRQITLLNKASIMTIDSFCLRVVKENFFKLDLDPNFRIGDQTEIELLKLDTIEELMEEKYDSQDKDFENLINIYTGNRDDNYLKDLILSIYNFIQSSPYPEIWLNEKCDMYNIEYMDFSETIWGEFLINYAKNEVDGTIDELEELETELFNYEFSEKYMQVITEDILKLKAIRNKLNKWDEFFYEIEQLEFSSLKPSPKLADEIKEKVKSVRDKMKKNIKEYLKDNIFISNSKEILKDIKVLNINLKHICKLVIEFGNKLLENKKSKNILDFSDVEHFCLKLLDENEEITNLYKEKYHEIMIDEYQDSNLIQEYILNKISNNKMFMVGDVKQSIYRFRQARPELFMEKYNIYEPIITVSNQFTNQNTKILLFKNFRSNKNIIDSTNYIFKNIMTKELGEIDYNENEYLKFGAEYYTSSPENTEFHIIETESDLHMPSSEEDTLFSSQDSDIEDNPQLEGRFIANRISEIIGKVDIYDKRIESTRKAEYKDIVILLRSTKGYIDSYIQELSMRNIPVYAENNSGYFQNMEVQIILSLLKIIDNPLQDIPLLTVLRSQIGDFTIDELTEIRLIDKNCTYYEAMQKSAGHGNKKVEAFLNKLQNWREKSKYLSLSKLLWELYNDTDYYYYISLLPGGEVRQSNLKLLLERAENYEKTSYKGLFNFLNFIENLKESSGDYGSSKIIGENENVVRIMSIHKSKGLEFPIVFLAGTSRKFNMRDLSDKIVFHQELGFGADVVLYDKRLTYPSIPKLALIHKAKIEALSEEMRILYVAMTRAKEKLIITCMAKNAEKKCNKWSGNITKHYILKSNSFSDWIGKTIINKENNFEAKVWKYNDVITLVEEDLTNVNNRLFENIDTINNEFKETINEKLSWEYPYIKSTTLPTKTTVTEIKRIYDEFFDNRENGANVNEKIKLKDIVLKPKFMTDNNLSGASLGTLIHSILQKIDFSKPDIKSITDKFGIKENEQIYSEVISKINSFLSSNICNRVIKSNYVYKEIPFNLNINANDIYGLGDNYEEEKIMIQGVIDLFFIENGEIVLLDYKTDNIYNIEEFINKYKIQLEYYKKAIESITNMKVKEMYIYSFKLNKEILL